MKIRPGIYPLTLLLVAAVLSNPSLSRPASLTPICQIQGSGEITPFSGDIIITQGVVFADLDQTSKKGFYLQQPGCDSDPSTSDGVFVYLGSAVNVASLGDLVEVTGVAQEYYGMTEIAASPSGVVVLAGGQPLPAPVELNPPFETAASVAYLESREGMAVQMASAIVVGPTDSEDQTWVAAASLGVSRVFYDDPAGTGEIVCVDDGGLYEITPEAAVGDQISGLAGWLEYSREQYRLQLLEQPTLARSPAVSGRSSSAVFSIATFNLHNFFDTVDDPATDDDVLSPTAYQRKLQKLALAIHAMGEPILIGVQEAENTGVLNALAMRPEITANYAAVMIDGPDARGIDVGLLYRVDAATVISDTARQGCTTLQDGLGPDGNGDVSNPQNAITCDTNSDGTDDGNRLFSRPPLVVRLSVSSPSLEIWVLVNHWKSKTEDTETTQYTLPRRLEQAAFVAGLAGEILDAQPGANLVILGDMNDALSSQPLAILEAAGLRNLWRQVDKPTRYSYLYQGISQEMDHVLISPALDDAPNEFMLAWPFHLNADFPASNESVSATERRSSDHDPLVVEYVWTDDVYTVYLPVARR